MSDNRVIFMLTDGAMAWEIKDFLIKQDRCEEVTIENKSYPGKVHNCSYLAIANSTQSYFPYLIYRTVRRKVNTSSHLATVISTQSYFP